MDQRRISSQLERMRRDWDQRARENARYYVATGKDQWTEEEFYSSGEVNFEQHVASDLGNVCQGRDPKEMRVLEIGCGAGRMTRAFARFFGQVYAVDISGQMVRQARRALAAFPNAQVFHNNGRDLSVLRGSGWNPLRKGARLPLDFAFSYIVFQHIPSREIIESYVREVNRVLRPGGLFKFQVQGYSELVSGSKESWVGVPFDQREAREMADRCGFEMRYSNGEGDQYYWLWYFKNREVG